MTVERHSYLDTAGLSTALRFGRNDNSMLLTIRMAVHADIPVLQQLIRDSVLALQAEDYSAQEMELALERVYGVDSQLVQDGTYFVAEVAVDSGATVIAGCGGWSKRKTLYGSDQCAGREDSLLSPEHDAARIRAFFVHPAWARRGIGSRILRHCEGVAANAGFRRLAMASTLTGVALYRVHGYVEGERHEILLAPGVSVAVIHMEKTLPALTGHAVRNRLPTL